MTKCSTKIDLVKILLSIPFVPVGRNSPVFLIRICNDKFARKKIEKKKIQLTMVQAEDFLTSRTAGVN